MDCLFPKSSTGVEQVDTQMNKYRKRMRRMCCCGSGWFFVGVVVFIIGLALVVKFSEHWGDEDTWKRHVAYTGAALLAIAVLIIVIGILLCVCVCTLYRRTQKSSTPLTPVRHQKYAPGEAPYPQQKYVTSPQTDSDTPPPPSQGNTAPTAPPHG